MLGHSRHHNNRGLADTDRGVRALKASLWVLGLTAAAEAVAVWFTGSVALLLIAAISFFGMSLGAIANGALSLAAILACPVGMYFMMRMMNKKERG